MSKPKQAPLATAIIEFTPGFKRRFINAPVSNDFKHKIINRRFAERKLDLSDCFETRTFDYVEIDRKTIHCKFVAPTNLQFMNIPAMNYACDVSNIEIHSSRIDIVNAKINQMKTMMLRKQKPIVIAHLMRYVNRGNISLFTPYYDEFETSEINQ